MRQAVEECRRELLVPPKDGDLFGKGPVGRHDRGASFVPVGEQVKEQFAAGAVEGHTPELVDDEHLDTEQPTLQAPEVAGVAGVEQLADEIGGAGEEHPTFLSHRLEAEGHRQVRFPGANGAREDEILGPRDPLAAG